MGGGGSIPIEAMLNWPLAAHFCGDNHELASPRALANLKCISEDDEIRYYNIYHYDEDPLKIIADECDFLIKYYE
jgi:hypothetical protein